MKIKLNANDFIDAHSHQISDSSCFNLDFFSEIPILNRNIPQDISFGFHPWNKGSFSPKLFQSKYFHLKNSKDFNLVAIGEIGIDRLQGKSLEEQTDIFEKLVIFAQEQKHPIVVHCVKAFEDIYKVLKDRKFSYGVYFHDFNGNEYDLKRILENDWYVGLGPHLFRSNSKIIQKISSFPLSNILLESDEGNNSIEMVFSQASKLFCLGIPDLKALMMDNYRKFFELS